MKILFSHWHFPAQFFHLVSYLSQNPDNQIFFITSRKENNEIPNITRILYEVNESDKSNSHNCLKDYEDWILHGQAAGSAALQLKNEGFIPDIIYAHCRGNELFLKEVYPNTPLLCYFEWYDNAYNSVHDFNKDKPLTIEMLHRIKIQNSLSLTSLMSCDHGITPTAWQLKQLPEKFHDKISVIHDGVCNNFFSPNSDAKLVIPEIGLDLSKFKEIVTYATSGMESVRGFPQFMEAAAIIQKRRPDCHIVIGGNDTVVYGNMRTDGKSYKQYMLETVDLDRSRIHFTGFLTYNNYLKLLQCSHAHVYLTYPYVLSWSLIEALSVGCMVIGSDTNPVKEVIDDGENGLLVDFFCPEQIANRVDEVFANPEKVKIIRENARKTAKERYNVENMLAKQINLINSMIRKETIKPILVL